MFRPIKVMDIELSGPLSDIEGLADYGMLKALVRLHGAPLGYVTVPLSGGRCTAAALGKAILAHHSWAIVRHLLHDGLAAAPQSGGLRLTDLLNAPHPVYTGPLPLVTVAVCTRDRTANLSLCLDSLGRLDYPALDLVVVDNDPSSDATERLVGARYANVRYLREPRPGLDWARNRAALEARGEIIAYTDDDVVVDPSWVSALARVFAENAEVMAVTGLVVPYELETEPQLLFEQYGGFGRGFERKWYRLEREYGERETLHIGAGRFGTGANMAYRRSLFDQIGRFDTALDVGTVTNGGGDLEMFFRLLQEGHTLVYEPSAIVRHRHRRDYAELRTQLTNNGVGFYAYLVRSARAYPSARFAILRFGLWWKWRWHIRRLLISFLSPTRFPRDLILAELRGAFSGLVRYQKALGTAASLPHTFGTVTQATAPDDRGPLPAPVRGAAPAPVAPDGLTLGVGVLMKLRSSLRPTAIRIVDLGQPLPALTEVQDYTTVRVFVAWNGRPLGSVDIANRHQPISAARLREAIVDGLILKLLEPGRNLSKDAIWATTLTALTQHYMPTDIEPVPLPAEVSASIVVATHDRPEDLRNCLRGLVAQGSPRRVEIVVVDNNPASGLTPPVVAEFPGVMLVNEQRKGASYARNKGVSTSRGDLVITTDDDVTLPPDWLEKLVAPFVRTEVMAVTGNVLPLELETPAQRLFETYGGLGRGFEGREANRDWFGQFLSAVPTWRLGGTANAAFRATIFNHPQIGLMDEALGPGTPTGVGEDTYLFYKILKAGYTIVYEPSAYVWHKHRRDMRALRRQIYNYSKGHVAYQLTTLIRDRDLRGLAQLVTHLPVWHMRRIKARLLGKSSYPVSLILLEVVGNLVGPWSLWQSRRRVQREGLSEPYIPVPQRSTTVQAPRLVETDHYATVNVV